MISQETIEEVKNRLVKTYDPISIYLFGSYAWGHPTEDSDLDLLIVVEHSEEIKYKRPVPGYMALIEVDAPNEIIVYTSEEFKRNSSDITTLAYKIKREGKLLYAKT